MLTHVCTVALTLVVGQAPLAVNDDSAARYETTERPAAPVHRFDARYPYDLSRSASTRRDGPPSREAADRLPVSPTAPSAQTVAWRTLRAQNALPPLDERAAAQQLYIYNTAYQTELARLKAQQDFQRQSEYGAPQGDVQGADRQTAQSLVEPLPRGTTRPMRPTVNPSAVTKFHTSAPEGQSWSRVTSQPIETLPPGRPVDENPVPGTTSSFAPDIDPQAGRNHFVADSNSQIEDLRQRLDMQALRIQKLEQALQAHSQPVPAKEFTAVNDQQVVPGGMNPPRRLGSRLLFWRQSR